MRKSTSIKQPIASADGGIDELIRGVSHLAWLNHWSGSDVTEFVHSIAERYANIRLGDIGSPRRFLAQMAGAPPERLGTQGFRAELVDDHNPARHYIAFLFVGYHLPRWMAVQVLMVWEIAGFVRYGGKWSWPDVRSGLVGVRHGVLVRKYAPVILPALIASELAEPDSEQYQM